MNPVLFELPWGPANSYGTMILLGGALTLPGVWWDAKRRKVGGGAAASFVVDFYLVLIVGAFLGGRVLHLLTAPEGERPGLLEPSASGFVFFGSLIAVVAGWVWLSKRHKLSFGELCDIGATWMGLGHAFGRLGCFLAGCCFGAPTDGAFGLEFPAESVVFHTDEIARAGDHTVAIHPTQLYESLGLLTIFVVLIAWRIRAGIEPTWRQASRYAIGYGALRFCTELFRGDASRGFLFEVPAPSVAEAFGLPPEHALILSISQGVAVLLVTAGVVGYAALPAWRIRARPPPRAATPDEDAD